MRVNNGLTPQELEAYGISDVHDIVYNPSYDLLYQEELDPSLTGYERGVLTNLGAVAVDTGIFTGRSPKDKYIVRDDTTRDTFWWADKGKGKNDNKPLSPETWQHLKGLVTRQLSGKRLFVVDAFCGANPDTRLSVRFITEVAWQAHFVKNMFIRLFIRTGDVDGKPAAGGMLLQVMPAQNAQQDDFDHLATLTETIKTEELLTLPANEVLWRLYHEEEVTVYDPQDVEFKCTCSRERCADALKTLPDEEVDSILAEDGEIDMHCDYCGNHYLFNAMDIAEIRNNASPADPQVH